MSIMKFVYMSYNIIIYFFKYCVASVEDVSSKNLSKESKTLNPIIEQSTSCVNQKKNTNTIKRKFKKYSIIKAKYENLSRIDSIIYFNEVIKNIDKNSGKFSSTNPLAKEKFTNKNFILSKCEYYTHNNINFKFKIIANSEDNINYYNYISYFKNFGLKLYNLIRDDYFTSDEKLKILLLDRFFEAKLYHHSIYKKEKIFIFRDVFESKLFNKTCSKNLKGCLNLLYQLINKGKKTGKLNKKCILPFNEAFYMLQKILKKLILNLEYDNKKTTEVFENNSIILFKKLCEIKKQNYENFIFLCDNYKDEDENNYRHLLEAEEKFRDQKNEFIKLIDLSQDKINKDIIIKILTCFNIIESSLLFYSYAFWYDKHFSLLFYFYKDSLKYYEVKENLSKLIIGCFNFILDKSFFKMFEDFEFEINIKYWKDFDLKDYFDLEKFWLINKKNKTTYLQVLIDSWSKEIKNNVFPDVNKVYKLRNLLGKKNLTMND